MQIGMVGLGVMGRNLVLNMADHGHSVVGYDKDPEQNRRVAQGIGKPGHPRRNNIERICWRCSGYRAP